jgi:glutamine cyclotransferase
LDPQTFQVVRRIRVKQGRRSVDKLNELEFVDGTILANIWYSDQIAQIDPQSGEVVGWIDCSHLFPISQRPDREHVLNGIAYDQASQRMFVTGKLWPNLFEIKPPR